MLIFKTSCAVLAYLSSNLLNEIGSLFRHFEVGLRVCDIVVKKFTFAISSPDEFLSSVLSRPTSPLSPPYLHINSVGAYTDLHVRKKSRISGFGVKK